MSAGKVRKRDERTESRSEARQKKLTDELVSVVEILPQILLAGIGGWELLEEYSTRGDVVAREIRRDVENARDAQSVEFVQIGRVSTVTQIEKGKNLRRRVGIHIRLAACCCVVAYRRRSTTAAGDDGHALLTLAQVRITSLEFKVST